jgi:spore coat polysaccharide biosynthesis protein SpsF
MLVAGDTCDADVMVRVTADDPFKDPVVMGLAVSTFLREPGIDLCQNVHPRTCPVGVDIEVLSMSALRRVERLASTPVDREHVTSFFYGHANDFLIVGIGDTANPYIDVRLTIDTQQDLDFVSLLATRHEDNPLVNYEVLAQEAASRASASFDAL